MPLVLIDGAKRAGKSTLITKFLKEDDKNGILIMANYRLYFGNPTYFHTLEEIFDKRNCSIGMTDGQRLLDVRRFMSLPPKFAEMVASTGHDHVNLYIDTQDIFHVDKRVRDNVDIYYHVKRIFRFPFNEEDRFGKPKEAIIQISRYWEHKKFHTPAGFVRWKRGKGKWLIISRFQKKLFETHEKLSLSRYVWKLIKRNGKTKVVVISRRMIEAGKARA